MINFYYANKFCIDNVSLIENYELAKKDLLETWHIHHRREDEGFSKQELINLGLYYKRPASELIFLRHKEHMSLHMKGRISPMKGKHHSEETRVKMSESKKGENHPMYGKTGEKNPTSKPVQQISKNTGEIIKIWACARDVTRLLGINPSNISLCCLDKRKSAGGYIWRYA